MSIPAPQDFLLRTPLYEKHILDGENDLWAVMEVLFQEGTYDTYCPKCQRASTFLLQIVDEQGNYEFKERKQRRFARSATGVNPLDPPILETGLRVVRACCSRNSHHTQHFIFFTDEDLRLGESGQIAKVRTITKVGQQPSFADIHLSEVKKFKGVLPEAQLRELSRAIGLASHDVGVGSYVYLRRVFEFLVEEAHQRAQLTPTWEEKTYRDARMPERVALLKSELPQFLVEHKNMYGLLSQGIHEWSEEACLAHFEALRLAIKLILDERLEQREKKATLDAATAALQKVTGQTSA